MDQEVEHRITTVETTLSAVVEDLKMYRVQNNDVLERLFSRLNDVHTRLAVQQEYSGRVAMLESKVALLQSERDAINGSLKTIGIAATVLVTVGAAVGWLINFIARK